MKRYLNAKNLKHRNVKWKKFLSDGVKLPTPWEKEEYDRTNFLWQELRKKLNKRTSDLKRAGAEEEEISEAESRHGDPDRQQRQPEAGTGEEDDQGRRVGEEDQRQKEHLPRLEEAQGGSSIMSASQFEWRNWSAH